MIAGVLGVIGFVLVLFVVGAFMEENLPKAGKFGAALVVCLLAIFLFTKPGPFKYVTNCSIDWDGRSNSEICD